MVYVKDSSDPLAILGMKFTKTKKQRQVDLFVFPDLEAVAATSQSSIKTYLNSVAGDKGNYWIDKVAPVESLANLLEHVGVSEDKLVFTRPYTDTSYFLEFKHHGLLSALDPPLPAELATGYEKGPYFRSVSGEKPDPSAPKSKSKKRKLDVLEELQEAKVALAAQQDRVAELEAKAKDHKAARIAKLQEELAELGQGSTLVLRNQPF
jgi:hypothetical protein